MLPAVGPMDAFAKTISQFVWFLSVLIAVPSLALLAWGLLDPAWFARGTVLGLSLAEIAGVAAVGTVVANGVAYLRPDDVTGWMAPIAGLLLLAFAGAMVLLFVLPG